MDDENKTFRTRLVSFWMLSNAALAVAIENINGLPAENQSTDDAELRKKQNVYFSIILYSTFALAAVRFTGVSQGNPHLNIVLLTERVVPLVLLQA